jgi:hypothetical protein
VCEPRDFDRELGAAPARAGESVPFRLGVRQLNETFAIVSFEMAQDAGFDHSYGDHPAAFLVRGIGTAPARRQADSHDVTSRNIRQIARLKARRHPTREQ